MDVFETKDIQVIQELYPYLDVDESFSKEDYVREIAGFLIKNPSDICIIVVYDNQTLLAFLIGWLLQNRNFSWIQQAWSADAIPRAYSLKAMKLFELWTKQHGLNLIRMETKRNIDAMERTYGFEVQSAIMQRDLNYD